MQIGKVLRCKDARRGKRSTGPEDIEEPMDLRRNNEERQRKQKQQIKHEHEQSISYCTLLTVYIYSVYTLCAAK